MRPVFVCTLGSLLLSLAGPAAAALLNPGFETPSGALPIPDWVNSGIVSGLGQNIFRDTGTFRSGAASAKMFSQFTSAENFSFLIQDQPAAPGQQWEASIWVRHNSGDALAGANRAELKLEFVNAGDIGFSQIPSTILTSASATDVWTQHIVSGVAPVGTVESRITLVFVGDAANSAGAALFDDASLSLIPEPGTFALAALGLLSLGMVGWRRRRR